ncbi:MAG: OpgC domain-containing protein [Prevotella sp.]
MRSPLCVGRITVLVLAFCFLSVTAYLKKFIHGKPLEVALYVGRNTLPIYMFHPIFTMAGKFILPAFQFDGTGILHAIVVILMGIWGSIFIGKVLDKCHLSFIFGKQTILR